MTNLVTQTTPLPSQESVEEQYARFIEYCSFVQSSAPKTEADKAGDRKSDAEQADERTEVLGRLWERAYRRDEDHVSLNVLPQTKVPNADSLLLLLYGYQVLLERDNVQSTDLMDSAKQSGVRIDRIDRSLPASHSVYVIKGGNGKGSRYSLNNRGLQYAQDLLSEMFE